VWAARGVGRISALTAVHLTTAHQAAQPNSATQQRNPTAQPNSATQQLEEITVTEAEDWNSKIIEEFRANGGKVGGNFEGAPLLLLHTVGAKSGQPRVNPMMYQKVSDGYAVFASYAGAPTNPAWYHNLLAHPQVQAEIGTDTVDLVA